MRILILLFLLISCQDKVTEPLIENTSTTAACPPVNTSEDYSQIDYHSDLKINSVGQNYVNLSFNKHSKLMAYAVLNTKKGQTQVLKTFSETNQVTINNLLANTEYSLSVIGIDLYAKKTKAHKSVDIKTLTWPDYLNTQSISLNGSQSIELFKSHIIDKDNFAISLWAQTSFQNNKSHLFTLHKENHFANTALAIIALKNNYGLKIGNKVFKSKVKIDLNEWNHLTVSVNNESIKLYVNSLLVLDLDNNIDTFGQFKASLGSLSGIRKGFNGMIDELLVFNSSITQSEIDELYIVKNNISHTSKLSKHLGLWFNFEHYSGTSVKEVYNVIGNISHTCLNFSERTFVKNTP